MSFRVCSSPKSRRSGLESHRTWITPPNLSEPAQTSAIHANLIVKSSNLIYSRRLEQIPQTWGNLTDLVKPLTRGCRGSCDRYSASKVEEYSCCLRIGVHTWHFRKRSIHLCSTVPVSTQKAKMKARAHPACCKKQPGAAW